MNCRTCLVLPLLGLTLVAMPMWALRATVNVPLERLLANTEKRVRNEPNDAAAHYVLGRLNSLALVADKRPVATIRGTEARGQLAEFPPYEWIYRVTRLPATLTPKKSEHLRRMIREYRLAVKLDPTKGLYRLGLGWALETSAPYAETVLEDTQANVVKGSIDAYRATIRLEFSEDMKAGVEGPMPFFSREAAQGILRLVAKFPQFGRPNDKAIHEKIVKLIDGQPRAVTPILVPLQGETRLDGLLSQNTTTFDLAGDDLKRTWPWVRRTTGILVWDPLAEGKITSGRQLFGSATWWMFFTDGYQALASLDDNRDGWLTGRELRGIRIWVDRDGNGKSIPSEVSDLVELGIEALRAKGVPSMDGPYAAEGVRWSNGKTSPTFDWTPVSNPVDSRS